MHLTRARSEVEINLAALVIVLEDGGGGVEPPDPNTIRNWLRPPIQYAQTFGGGWQATSMRDQVEIVVLGSRLEIKDHSGQRDFSKLANCAVRTLEMATAGGRAYGVNFHIPLPVDFGASPGLFVARHFLAFERLNGVAPVESATVEVRLRMDDALAGLQFRPRVQPEDPADLLVTVNVHHNANIRELAGSEGLELALRRQIEVQLDRVLDIIERL